MGTGVDPDTETFNIISAMRPGVTVNTLIEWGPFVSRIDTGAEIMNENIESDNIANGTG